jgi:hypothetical protein
MGEIEKNLGQLAEEINAEHRAFVGTFQKTVEHGIRAGELLSTAKAECAHGTWLPWLEENFEGAARTAQEYMRLHNHRDEIRAKYADSAHLSIGAALKELAAPKDAPRPERPATLEEMESRAEAALSKHDAAHEEALQLSYEIVEQARKDLRSASTLVEVVRILRLGEALEQGWRSYLARLELERVDLLSKTEDGE